MSKNSKYRDVLFYASMDPKEAVEWCPVAPTEHGALEKYVAQEPDVDKVFVYKLHAVYARPKAVLLREEVK